MPALSPDLIYYCGQSLPWDPRNKDLGGSEQAVVELSRHWAQAGLKVEVYGSIPEAMVCDGVTYRPIQEAAPMLRADVVMLWRLYGLMGFWKGLHRFQCRLVAVDFHDRELFGHEELLYQSRNQLHALMFKSQFHADFLLNKLAPEKQAELRNLVKIIPNGIRKQDFTLADPPPREPHRFCYASCYLRGLVPLIRHFWPTVRQLWPDAELHVYYGMDHVRDPATRQTISEALKSAGVQEHGRQPVTVISEEKHRSSFHLYYTNSLVETDCISIKESAYAGCIPIISGVNVFAERSGIVMPGNAVSEEDFRQAAQAFVTWAQKTTETELKKIRQSLHDVKSHRDWAETAVQWSRRLELVPPEISWRQLQSVCQQIIAPKTTPEQAAPQGPSQSVTLEKRIRAIKYINLHSSTAREKSIRTQLLRSYPASAIQRLEAIDGRKHQLTEPEIALFEGCSVLSSCNAASLRGNVLSHLKIWRSASQLAEDELMIVLQDDAILCRKFKQHLTEIIAAMPADATFVMLSDHELAIKETFVPINLETQSLEYRKSLMKEIITPHVGKREDSWMTHCMLAYIITSQGAKDILAYTTREGIKLASDHHIRKFLVSRDQNYASVRCLATSSSKVFKSEVWN